MNALSYLATLPAVLSATGFVVYRLLGTQSESSRVTGQIVEKLRADMPERSAELSNLPPRELSRELERDHHLRSSVGEKNFGLLRMVLQQEHTRSLVIYVLCALLFVLGVVAFVFVQLRPTPLELDDWHLESTNSVAQGMAIDLDDLRLNWVATGPDENLAIALENIQTRRRTNTLNVSSNTGQVIFKQGELAPVLAERQFKDENRVRAVAHTRQGDVFSPQFLIHVGLHVLVLPDTENASLLIAATIDHTLVQDYHFEIRALAWKKQPAIAPESWSSTIDGKYSLSVPGFGDFDWSTLKVIYMGPDDPRLVRCGP